MRFLDKAVPDSGARAEIAEELWLMRGMALMRGMRGHLSGLCQPTYVLDIPNGHGKSPIGPNYIERTAGVVVVEDFKGERHRYPPQIT